MFWLNKFSGGPRRSNNIFVSYDGEIFAFVLTKKEDTKWRTPPNNVLKVSVLNPQKFLWRHHDLQLPLKRNIWDIYEVVNYDGLIYLFFFDYIFSDYRDRTQVFTLHPKNYTLTKLELGGKGPEYPFLPCCIIGDLLYAYSGILEPSSMFCLNFLTHEWSHVKAPGPRPGNDTSCIVFGPKTYFWGGRRQEEEGEEYIYGCEMYAFDTRNNSFEVIEASGDIPVGRDCHSMFLYDGKIFVYGGRNENGVNASETFEVMKRSKHSSEICLDQFFCFDIGTRIW